MTPTAFALHAAGVTPAMWEDLREAMPDTPLVAPDLDELAARRPGSLSHLLDALVEAAPPGPLLLAGTAWGCHPALELAARLGPRVRGTLLIAPGPPELDADFLSRIRALERMVTGGWSGELARTLVPVLLYRFGPRYRTAAPRLEKMLDRAAPHCGRLLGLTPAFRSASELLPRLAGPVRVLFGSDNGNPVPGPGVVAGWRDLLGAGAVELVPSAGEYVPLDRPDVVAAALRELAKVQVLL